MISGWTPDALVSLAAREPAPDGFRYVAVRDPDWVTVITPGTRCRFNGNLPDGTRARCTHDAVAALNRGRSRWFPNRRPDQLWPYCAGHMYGRWVEDGVVYSWRLRPLTDPERNPV